MSQYSHTDLTTTMLGDQQWDQPEWDTSFFWEENKNTIKPEPPFDELYGQIGDVGLLDKAKTAEKTGDLLPLIKEELKCKIQAKRLANGKGEITINTEKPKVYQVTSEGIQRREKRRAQNRRAAKKYRIKQRLFLSTDREETIRLQKENVAIREEINQLLKHKQQLLDLLHLHQSKCNINQTVLDGGYNDVTYQAVVPDRDNDIAFQAAIPERNNDAMFQAEVPVRNKNFMFQAVVPGSKDIMFQPRVPHCHDDATFEAMMPDRNPSIMSQAEEPGHWNDVMFQTVVDDGNDELMFLNCHLNNCDRKEAEELAALPQTKPHLPNPLYTNCLPDFQQFLRLYPFDN